VDHDRLLRDTGPTAPAARRRPPGADPTPAPPRAALLRLNRQAGNAAVVRLLAGPPVVQRAYATQQDAARAVEQLQERFPKLTIKSTIQADDEEFWARYLKGQSLARFVESLLGPLLTPGQRTGVTIDLFPSRKNGACVGVQVKVDAANPRLHLNQEYLAENGRLVVNVENIEAPGGQGRQFFERSLLAQAKDLGVTRLDLTASASGARADGVVAWARYGFVPTGTDWDRIRRRGLALLAEPDPAVPNAGDVRQVLMCPAPVALRRLVFLSWRDGEATRTLLNRSLSVNVSWVGSVDLTDSTSRAWIEAYASGPAPDARLGIFEPLLPDVSEQRKPPADEDEEVDESTVAWLVEGVRAGTLRLVDVLWQFGAGAVSRVRALLDALNTG
jgi:hypothetical protein